MPMCPCKAGEDQARYIVTLPAQAADAFLADAKAAGVPASQIGQTAQGDLKLEGSAPISLASLTQAYEGWFPTYMAAPDINE
jgi:hypothetical protein